ncbi:MmyB family transcriptional regulator [Streptomyces orinoci]|uniref:Helix-turn-helix domain-containing protein n=1 Tax=Streptomyces orinoci TaxID=67339 RepID=A0ABV3K6H5_STRON|nr:helix-turn-helix domain-containing protein [Streptomyces orinoci]
MDKQALQALLRESRALIDPGAYGLFRSLRQGRRAPGLTQAQMDQLLHRAQGTYNRLETGNYPNPSEDLLRDVARLLAFTEHEWTLLWRYTLRRDPPTPLDPGSGQEVVEAWREVVHGISHMAYVADQSWRVLDYNQPFADLFPGGKVPENSMRWMANHADARRILARWEECWLPLILPQLRSALAAMPDDPTLAEIKEVVLADPVTGPMFRAGGVSPGAQAYRYERPLLHPLKGPGWVHMCPAQPLDTPGIRLMIIVFHPGEDRPGDSRLRALSPQ